MKGIVKLQDGNKGVVFKIINDDDTEEVIKLQAENSARAIVGTAMLKKAGANAPNIRAVKGTEYTDLEQEVGNFIQQAQLNGDVTSLGVAQQLAGCLQKARDPNSDYNYRNVVRMDYASGLALDKAWKNDPQKFKAMMTNPEFHKQLGQIMAGDAYGGNGDRFVGRRTGKQMEGGAEKITGWFNPGNIIIEGEGKDLKLKAIDNDLVPGRNLLTDSVFGYGNFYAQGGSVAAANTQQLKREVFAIAQKMEELSGVKLSPQELYDFIENTTKGAKQSMDVMLKSEFTPEHVSGMLHENGESFERALELGTDFASHRQLVHMLANDTEEHGVKVQPSVKQMLGIAKEKTELTTEKVLKGLGLPDDVVKEITAKRENLDEFNKLNNPLEQERFTKLMQGERGAHVPKDFKLTVKEAALLAKDESTYKQFTHKPGGNKV